MTAECSHYKTNLPDWADAVDEQADARKIEALQEPAGKDSKEPAGKDSKAYYLSTVLVWYSSHGSRGAT